MAAPANDNFLNAQLITDGSSYSGSNVGATYQSPENDYTDTGVSNSVWFKWTPSLTGIYRIHTTGTSFRAGIKVFIGDNLPISWEDLTGLDFIEESNLFGNGKSYIEREFLSSIEYKILLGNVNVGTPGNYILSISSKINSPVNDNFINAIEISGETTVTGSISGATEETGEDALPGDLSPYHTVWYKWTPDEDGTYVFSLENSDFDTILKIYTGTSILNLSLFAENDDSDTSSGSRISDYFYSSTEYFIQIGHYSNIYYTNSYELNISKIIPPENDIFENAQLIETSNFEIIVDNSLATNSSSEDLAFNFVGYIPYNSLWYEWIAPSDGILEVSAEGNTVYLDSMLAVFYGETLASAIMLQFNDEELYGDGDASKLNFYVKSGESYKICLSSRYSDGFGEFIITGIFTNSVVPSNIFFSGKEILGQDSFSITGTTFYSYCENDSFSLFPEINSIPQILWYEWTAPATGELEVICTGDPSAFIETKLYAFEGTDLNNLIRLEYDKEGSPSDYSTITINGIRGHSYKIAVVGQFFEGNSGSFSLVGTFTATPDDKFESICSVPSDTFDELWCVVNRKNGRMIERMAARSDYDFCGGENKITSLDQIFMDSAVEYSSQKELTLIELGTTNYYRITSPGHGYSNDDIILLRNVANFPELSYTKWRIGYVTEDTFFLIERI